MVKPLRLNVCRNERELYLPWLVGEYRGYLPCTLLLTRISCLFILLYIQGISENWCETPEARTTHRNKRVWYQLSETYIYIFKQGSKFYQLDRNRGRKLWLTTSERIKRQRAAFLLDKESSASFEDGIRCCLLDWLKSRCVDVSDEIVVPAENRGGFAYQGPGRGELA